MQKRTFRIGQLAKNLEVERFVVRFWEKEFQVKTSRSHGGQRFYTEDDLIIFQLIKDLLYNRGFTIAGAKQEIRAFKLRKSTVVPSLKTTINDKEVAELKKEKELLEQRVLILQQQLIKLRQLL